MIVQKTSVLEEQGPFPDTILLNGERSDRRVESRSEV